MNTYEHNIVNKETAPDTMWADATTKVRQGVPRIGAGTTDDGHGLVYPNGAFAGIVDSLETSAAKTSLARLIHTYRTQPLDETSRTIIKNKILAAQQTVRDCRATDMSAAGVTEDADGNLVVVEYFHITNYGTYP